MKRCLITLALALTAAAPAMANPTLAASKHCMACHAVQKKLVGPSYQDVARKYRGQPDAVQRLAQKIRQGGSGVWGPVPMPASPRVTEDEAAQLATWVLATPAP